MVGFQGIDRLAPENRRPKLRACLLATVVATMVLAVLAAFVAIANADRQSPKNGQADPRL